MIEKVKISDVPELTEVKENAFVFVIDGTEPLVADRTKRIQLTNIVAPIVPSALPYKVYTALLTQSGTSAPVATVLENTTGSTMIWVRENTGYYSLNSSLPLFGEPTKWVAVQGAGNNSSLSSLWFYSDGPTQLGVEVYDLGNVNTQFELKDDQLLDQFIEIRVYN
jgi:hypothetical protein